MSSASSQPAAPSTTPATADPLLWGPHLNDLWVSGGDDGFIAAATAAEQLFVHDLQGVVPHGTFSRVMTWARTGRDPGEPRCTCGCVDKVPVA